MENLKIGGKPSFCGEHFYSASISKNALLEIIIFSWNLTEGVIRASDII